MMWQSLCIAFWVRLWSPVSESGAVLHKGIVMGFGGLPGSDDLKRLQPHFHGFPQIVKQTQA